ncbi:Long-chain-fatty-acid--CoA ligase 6 [Balamuthia mandrillaris]
MSEKKDKKAKSNGAEAKKDKKAAAATDTEPKHDKKENGTAEKKDAESKKDKHGSEAKKDQKAAANEEKNKKKEEAKKAAEEKEKKKAEKKVDKKKIDKKDEEAVSEKKEKESPKAKEEEKKEDASENSSSSSSEEEKEEGKKKGNKSSSDEMSEAAKKTEVTEQEKKEEEKEENEDEDSSSSSDDEGEKEKATGAAGEDKKSDGEEGKGKGKEKEKEKGKEKEKDKGKEKEKEKEEKQKSPRHTEAKPAPVELNKNPVVASYKHPDLKRQSIVYDEKEGIRRNAGVGESKDLASELYEGIDTLYKNFQTSVKRFPNNPCLGTREYVQRKKEWVFGRYVWQTYKQVADRVTHFGSGLRGLGLKKGDKIGLWAKNREEWIIAEQAANAYGLVTVAIYDTFGEEAVSYVIEHAEISTIICAPQSLKTLAKVIKDCPNLKYAIVMEDTIKKAKKEEQEAYPDLQHAKGIPWAEIEQNGKDNEVEHDPPAGSDLAVLMYTSGTTGNPKGVMLTHNNFTAALASVIPLIEGIHTNDVYISYLPLAHIFERTCFAGMLGNGASVGFYSGDPRNLVADIEVLKPTLMAGVPRVFDRIYAKVHDAVQKKPKLTRMLFTKGYNAKRHKLETGGDSMLWNLLVFKSVKNALGGRVRLIISGGAPLGAATQEFIRICFCCPVVQGYGLTETCSSGCITNPKDNALGQVGPPVLGVEIKLVDVPEMDYSAKADPPAGEIWIRGPSVSLGYYKDAEKTAEDYDADGWFHTGDIGTWTPEGTLKIIDRKKNIFKLAIGEYVAAEKLESVFIRSQFVSQIFVYGDSFENCLVAVIVVDPAVLKALGKQLEVSSDDLEELAQNKAIRKHIVKDLAEIATLNKLQRFEYIKAVHIVTEEWLPDSNLVTPTLKPKRPQLKKAYTEQIAAMYKEIAEEEAAKGGEEGGSSSAAAPKEETKDKKRDEGKGKDKEEKKKEEKKEDKKKEEKKKEDEGKGKDKEKKKEEKKEEKKKEEKKKEEKKNKKDEKKEEPKKEEEPKEVAKDEDESSSSSEGEAEAKQEEPKEEQKEKEKESSSSSEEESEHEEEKAKVEDDESESSSESD